MSPKHASKEAGEGPVISAGEHLRKWFAGRPRPMHILVVLLCIILGFALSTQVRSRALDPLENLSEEELVVLLADLQQREMELRTTKTGLDSEFAKLQDEANSRETARDAAERASVQALITAGALPVKGPGITYRISPGTEQIPTSVFVTALAELRNAGAEAIEIGGLRVGVNSWFGEVAGRLVFDGTVLEPPYTVRAIGDAQTLANALAIRGGTTSQFKAFGAEVTVTETDEQQIDAVRELLQPQWAEIE